MSNLYLVGLCLAALAAVGYTLASFFLKSALGRGASAGHLNLWANVAMGVIVQPMWLFDDLAISNAPLGLPLVTCCTFFLGQLCTFAALAKGDVSVATPLLGTKILWVTAMNALIFSIPVGARWWAASLAASVAIAIIAGHAPRSESRSVGTTAFFSIAAAVFFSITDVLVQHWAGGSDPLAYLPAMFGSVGVLSVVYYLFVDRRAFLVTSSFRIPLAWGVGFLGIQCALVFLSLAWTRDATVVNILYSARSLLTVGFAWGVGRFFGLHEAVVGRRVLGMRLAGALLLFGAILLILL